MEKKIYFKSDFEIIEQLIDAQGQPVDISAMDIVLIYSTDNFNTLKATCKNGECTNCYIDIEDNSKLHVIFSRHYLGVGKLAREVSIAIDNPHFKENIENVRFKEFASIELVAFGGSADNKVIDNTSANISFNHNQATNRDMADQHPISAITGLDEALSDKWQLQVLTDWVQEYKGEGSATFIGRNNKGATTADGTWRIKVLWYVNDTLTIHRFSDVAWDNRYNLIIL